MELTKQKIALIQKIVNAKLTKVELVQVLNKARSLVNKPKHKTVNWF